jgi:glycosyltransferase involved in cell wall biosynthesis
MRICLVSLDFVPYRSSGLAVYAENLARGLTQQGHQVTVIASGPRHRAAPEEDGYAERIFRLPVGPSNWIGYSFRASRLLERMQQEMAFDVVHFSDVHFAYAYRGSYVASLHQSFRQRLLAKDGLPYHSSLSNLVGRYLYYNLAMMFPEKRCLKKASWLIAVSESTKREFVEHYAVDEAKVDVVWEGINTNRFRRRDVAALRQSLDLARERILLYVGFSTPRKGMEYLGQALRLLDDDVRLMIVGRWERGYRERFLQAIGNQAWRIIEMGYVPDEEMPAYYSLADVLVLPSLLEGFGLPLVEAMACATPVVATTAGSIPEVVGDAGILVPPRDHRALADGINRILGEDGLRRHLGSVAEERVQKHFSVDRMAADTLEVYRRFMGEQRSS